MSRTKASVAIYGVLGVLALIFYVEFRFAAHASDTANATQSATKARSLETKASTLQMQLQDTQRQLQEALEDRAKNAERPDLKEIVKYVLQKQLQDVSVRPAQQTSIDYQSLWSAAHCTNPAVAQSLTPEQIANTTRIEEMMGPPGILVPYKVRVTAGKGRGLYATKPIPKGTMIIQCNRELRFDTHDEWKAFVACIPDVKLKSDVARWAWPTQSDSGGQWVMLSLDDGSLTNHCAKPTMGPHWSESDSDPDDSDSTDVRVRIGRQMIPSVQNTFALRDIEPGEELCDNYSNYNADESKHWFGSVSALDGIDR